MCVFTPMLSTKLAADRACTSGNVAAAAVGVVGGDTEVGCVAFAERAATSTRSAETRHRHLRAISPRTRRMVGRPNRPRHSQMCVVKQLHDKAGGINT